MAITNRQYVEKTLNGLNISDQDIDIILMKAKIEGDDLADISACDLAIYNRFSIILKGMVQNISEGGYSISVDVEKIKLYYNLLCQELGKENVLISKPKIRDRSNIW